MPENQSQDIKTLRNTLRSKRRALTAKERVLFSNTICGNLSNFLPFRKANHIAFYAATAEEVDTDPAIELAIGLEKTVYLPVINEKNWRDGVLLFHPFVPGETRMKKNRFGIPEPDCRIGECVQGPSLDLVCVPLVGFTEQCDRLGMGGGYYDKCFAKQGVKKTTLVGLAFECQKSEFDAQAHDVPLDAVVTEKKVWQI